MSQTIKINKRSCITVALLAVLSAALLPWAGYNGAAASLQLFAVSACALLGLLAMVLVIDSNAVAKMPISWIFVLALLLRCIAIFAMPLLEDDHFRYLWDAFQTQVEGVDKP